MVSRRVKACDKPTFLHSHFLAADENSISLRTKDMTRLKLLAFATVVLLAPTAFANVYGALRGVVHDPQHRPIQDAMVILKAKSSDWAKSVTTDATGQFQMNG